MEHTIKNEKLKIEIAEYGAEMRSIKANNIELLWQSDEKTWKNRATNLFPHVGRLTDGKYTYNGTTYEMPLHGFVKLSTLTVTNKEENTITFTLTDNEETRKMYPFSFKYDVKYTLEGNVLHNEYIIKNTGNDVMYFAVGGHPGFITPAIESLKFEDYYIEFEKGVEPQEIIFSDAKFPTDKTKPLVLDNGKLHLTQSLFDNDAIVFKNVGNKISLATDLSAAKLEMDIKDFQYLGLWNFPMVDVKYVCIEPWTTLPARDGVVEDFATQPDMITLNKNEEKRYCFSMTFDNF